MQGNGGSQRRHRQQDIENKRPQAAERQLLEDIRQSDEYQLGACRRCNPETEDSREDHDTGQYRDKSIDDRHLPGRCQHIGVFPEIRRVGDKATHAEAQREERLPDGA